MISFIQEFAVLFLVIVGLSFLIKLLKQPIIIAYVIAGFIFSFYIAQAGFDTEQIIILSELGITFMLFLMGLEFDLNSLKYIGKDLFFTTLLQSVIFFIVAFILSLFFHFTWWERFYLSILFMFSSTLFVAKWLEDKKETSTLHGKIILATLIIQDIVAILTITLIAMFQHFSFTNLIMLPIQGLALVSIGFILARVALNPLLKFASKYPEFLFVLSLGVCFLFVVIAPILGYSTTIGAFIGGITLANTIYKHDISARLKPLIVFFNLLFFVSLGIQLKLDININHAIFIILLSLLTFIVKPMVIYITLKMRGFDMKTSFISGLQLSQISEFGIIIMLGGLATGQINQEMSVLAIISVIVTMILSSYYIKYDKKIYNIFQFRLRQLNEYFKVKERQMDPVDTDCHIIFFGYYELGRDIYKKLEGLGKKIIVIENDPENIEKLKREGHEYIYNSVNNPEFFKQINFNGVELVVSSLIDINENKMIIKNLKRANLKAIAIVTAKTLQDAMSLYREQADYVICPSYLNEQHVSVLLEDFTKDINKILSKKISELTKLKEKEGEKVTADLFWDINSFLKAQKQEIKDDKNNGK